MSSCNVDLYQIMWEDLQLNDELKLDIIKEFDTPDAFLLAFDSEKELTDLLFSFQTKAIHVDALKRMVQDVFDWQARQQHRFRFLQMQLQERVKRPKLNTSKPAVNSQSVFADLVSISVQLKSKVSRTNHRHLLNSPNATKAELEKTMRDHWAATLVSLVQEAVLPVVEIAAKTADPVQTIIRAMGNRRAKTLRNRARSWVKFRDWLMLVKGHVFPTDVSDLLDYLWCQWQEGTSKSLIQSLAASLSVIEDIGMVKISERFSQNPLWIRTCKSYISEIDECKGSSKSAPPLSVAILVSLELEVCDESQPTYARALCWVILLAVWACMRLADFEGIDMRRIRLVGTGLSGVLTRTKTTGPGKRVHEVQFFVKRDITLSGMDWLAIGWEIWESYSEQFPRDYFLMKATPDWESPINRYLKPDGMAIYFRALLQRLRTPRRNRYTGLKLDDDHFLLCEDSLLHYSGHSMRHTLPTISAMMGCDKDDRDYLGRWHIPKQSQQYVNNSRQIIHKVQEFVASGLCTGTPSFDPRESLQDLKEFVDQRGGDGSAVMARNSILRHVVQTSPQREYWELGVAWPALKMDPQQCDVEEDVQTIDVGDEICDGDQQKSFFITISRKTGFRRLHKKHLCGLDWHSCYRVEFLDRVTKHCADSICATCKERGHINVNDDEDSSSSGSSSSTQ